jgi:ubiquinone/menaquinone biosynthesis C-methylase UbiE
MLDLATASAPNATLVRGDALALPFPDDAFERVVSGHFYGHLDARRRQRFLREVRRVAPEFVVVDASVAASDVAETWSHRMLSDGSTWEVFKRYFSPESLVVELGGGEVLHEGTWFVVVRSVR